MKSPKKKRPDPVPAAFRAALLGFSAFTLLDTFVIPKNVISADQVTAVSSYAAENTSGSIGPDGAVTNEAIAAADSTAASADADASAGASGQVITDTSYISDDLQITITTERVDNTTVYIADIQTTDPSKLMSGLADNSFGQNVSQTTSDIASETGALLAVNGDYYGFRSTGYVMRNGYLYRSVSAGFDQEDLVIFQDGTMDIIKESEVTAEELQSQGAVQIYSFGPGLVENGTITVDEDDEVDRATSSNPRTAIGQISEGHYVMVVSDGRTSESSGLTLLQLASVMQNLGCQTAYNLDGGGSSTMVFNGQIINIPVGGHGSSERKVSDIVYITA